MAGARPPCSRSPRRYEAVPHWADRAPVGHDAVVREHRYSFEMPHSAARIWALFQDYDRWTDYAPMVKRVDVL